MIWLFISLSISYAIIQPESFGGFIGTVLFSFIVDIIAVAISAAFRRF